jgi:hypothetical protein
MLRGRRIKIQEVRDALGSGGTRGIVASPFVFTAARSHFRRSGFVNAEHHAKIESDHLGYR